MALATWWSSDPLPELAAVPGFHARLAADDTMLATLNRLTEAEVLVRRDAGHRPYVGLLEGNPAAYGWVATEEASIGELHITMRLPRGNRYLWDFATLPGFQGRGLYPHLLQAILEHERPEAERFWIIHAPENLPSGAGMAHAGLAPVAELSLRADGGVGLAPRDVPSALARAQAGSALLGVPLMGAELAPCWRCGGSVADGDDSARGESCWPPAASHVVPCTCAIKRMRPALLAGA